MPRRPQGDGYKKSIREIDAIRGYLFQDELEKFWKIDALAQPVRVAYMRRNAIADLQRRNGHQQKRRARRAGLADHIRLQHVFVSDFEMGRRNFV